MRLGRQLSTVRKIAVVRANGIGDFCFALPALAALRAAYPEAEIVLLGKRWHADFLRGRRGPIDRVVVVPPYGGVSAEPGTEVDAGGLAQFFGAMQAEHFDLALQLHGGGRYSNPFTRELRARYAVGLRAPDAAPLDDTIPYIYFLPEIARYLEVVALVGARPVTLEPAVELTDADWRELARAGVGRDEPIAVLHPGASDPRRRWPADNFAAVGRALAARGARVAVIGASEERVLTQTVQAQVGSQALDLCDRLSLGGLAALLACSRVVVANDSGPLHLASAVGAATAGIYWCGNLINSGPMTRRLHRPAISWRLNCPICDRNTLFDNCAHRASFVADVPVDEITTAAAELYEQRAPAPADAETAAPAG